MLTPAPTVIAAQCRFLLGEAKRAMTDLGDEHRALQPAPGVKTAGWLIGHLCVTGDFARRLCERPPISPREWRAAFNPGTQPSLDVAVYSPMSALREMLIAVYSDLCDSVPAVDAAIFAKPNPYVPGQAGFPTSGDFVGYMMTGHFGYHLGQLTIWRAAAFAARRVNA